MVPRLAPARERPITPARAPARGRPYHAMESQLGQTSTRAPARGRPIGVKLLSLDGLEKGYPPLSDPDQGARKGTPIGINRRTSPSPSAGARAVGQRGEGLDGRPRPVLLGEHDHTPLAGDHQGPPNPSSTALAPTDHPASYRSPRLRSMPIGRPGSLYDESANAFT